MFFLPTCSICNLWPPELFTILCNYQYFFFFFPPLPLKLEICFFCLNDHSFFQKLLISEGPLGIMKRNNAMKPNKKVLGRARGTWLTILECHAYRISPCWTQVMSPDPSNISTLISSFFPCVTKNVCEVLIPL